jgi:hypothetical protein
VPAPPRPAEDLRGLAAPRELIEWVRKLPTETAANTAWMEAPRADWIPYVALLRGQTTAAILRATCQCAIDLAGPLEGPEAARVLAVLRATIDRGREALTTTVADLGDLKLAIIQWGHRTPPEPKPMWMYWAEIVLELAHANSRGNVMVGVSLAMKLIAQANTVAKPTARPAHLSVVARFRDKLTPAT